MSKWPLGLRFRRAALAALACLCIPGIVLGEPRKLVLLDFDSEADVKPHLQPPVKTISTDHAAPGSKHSLKVTLPSGWFNFSLDDPAMMKKLADYRTLSIDINNPTDHLLHFYAQVQDELSTAGKEARFDISYGFLPPGKGTINFSLSSLPRLWPHAGAYILDRTKLKKVWIFTGRDTGKYDPPLEFYITAVRAEDSGVTLPQVEGLRAFNFGISHNTGPAVDGAFTAVTQLTPAYSGTTPFGWARPPSRYFSCAGNPDDLGNSALGGAFAVNVKPGQYVVQTCIDPINMWGYSCCYSSRTLRLCGKEVLSEKMDGPTFVRDRYCMFEDDEDTPSTDLWKDRVKKISPVREFECTVGEDGKLTVEYNGDAAGGMCFVVVYPKEKATQGAAWMAALDAIRKERFDSFIIKGGIQPEGPAPDVTPDDKARGFIAFARPADKALNCGSAPTADEKAAPLAIAACPGERTAVQLGLYPLAATKGVTIAASDLAGPAGAKIPATAVELQKVRHYYKRFGNGPCMTLMPLVLEKFQTLDLAPGFTRPVWVTVNVPDKTLAGQYVGKLTIKAGDRDGSRESASVEVPLNVTVNPFTLDAADDVALSGMGTSAGFWRAPYPQAMDLWWQVAQKSIALQAEHGFNALTGGPGMKLKAIKEGKADIDFADADRWMDLARKYGLTKLGDSYQGFDVDLGFARDRSPEGAKNNEAAAKAAYNMTFAEVLKAAYAAVEQHAKDKNWPPRAYYLLDEPSGPLVEAGRVFVEAHVKNAPGSKFSGYYAPGDKTNHREVFYGLLQLSILSSFNEEVLKTIHAAGNQTWIYINPGYTSFENFRHLYGRWLFHAHARGLDGATGGYFYPSTVPYYDMSDIEGSWGLVYPSKDGMNPTVWLEKVALGINDYRYLKTLKARLDAAKKIGADGDTAILTPAKAVAIKEAEQFLAHVDKACNLHDDPSSLKPLAMPADFDLLRRRAIKVIVELSK
ncbi:MAG: glycoside hydrolase domain-containing protein [Phycisphaerae bacterium]